MSKHTVKFIPSGRGKAQCPADPRYPQGVALDSGLGGPSCLVALPYPAPECGHFIVDCTLCGIIVSITAAGRADDPVSVNIPCRLESKGNA